MWTERSCASADSIRKQNTVSIEHRSSSRPGRLYVVATPIGNLEDLSPRALRVLNEVTLILAEDTRVSARLLRHYGIRTPMRPYHDHNERKVVAGCIESLLAGWDLALISDAGTPLISDPGFHLVRQAHERGIAVIAVPGPSSIAAALSIAGLPTDRFAFEGFLPAPPAARRKRLAELRADPRTLVFLETPHRIAASLADMVETFGGGRLAALARELTKIHESVTRAPLRELSAAVAAQPERQRGEFVVCVEGAPEVEASTVQAVRVARVLRGFLPAGQAAAAAAQLTGASRNEIYRALQEREASGDG